MKKVLFAVVLCFALHSQGMNFINSATICGPDSSHNQIVNNDIEPARNEEDSIKSRQLEDVVVEADKVHMSLNKVSYTPTKQQRNASANGTMLLQHLAIPELRVDALGGTVTTNTGEAVAFFIDGVPATESDIADINTRDVLKVEVLDYPSDPKFRNSPHVVNYIMQKYEFGGYTKFNTTEMLLSCFSSYNTLNSKMVYKKMTYDVRGYYQYTNGSHYGSDEVHFFKLPGYENEAPDGITRSSKLESSKYISNRPSASFRALYQGNKTQYSSTLNWKFDGVGSDTRSGLLDYSPKIFYSDSWETQYPSHKNTVSWNNDFFQQLPREWSLSASFQLTFDHLNQTQKRSEDKSIIRDLTAKENLFSTSGSLEVSKNFNRKHSLSMSARYVTYKSIINYRGSLEDENHQTQFALAPGAQYTFEPSSNFYARLGLFATYYHSKSSGGEEKKVFPTVNFNMSWMPHRHHRFAAIFNYGLNTPSGSQTNSLLLQTDMLRWSQGNPDLHSYHTTFTQVNYNWMPSQYFNLSPLIAWVYCHNYFADTYSLTNDGKGILVRPDNCGDNHNIWGYISFAAYALNRSLIILAQPVISYDYFEGAFNISQTALRVSLSATYYLKQFYFGGSYSTPSTYYGQANPIRYRTRSQYWIMAGWGNSSWTVSAILINPFRTDWKSDSMEIATPDYSMRSASITVNDHQRINLSVAYTFGYGKKVERGNELEGVKGGSSSIR